MGRMLDPMSAHKISEDDEDTKRENSKIPINCRSDWPWRGPEKSHVDIKLGATGHLKSILKHLNLIWPIKLALRSAAAFLRRVRPGPRSLRGRGYRGRG